MGVDVQRGLGGNVPGDSGQGLHVHPVFKRGGHKQVAQVVKANPFASCVFQDGLEAFPNSGGVEGRVLLRR